MNNEIKQGDKVMVSKDAPKVYLSSVNNLFKYHVCKVEEVDGDSAIIRYTDIGIDRWLAIPTKYLVKVDAEAKEPKFKVGDRVRIKGCGYEPNLHKGDIGEILDTNGKEQCFVLFKKSQAWIYADCLEPHTEPTEQTEVEEDTRIRQKEAELEAFRKSELDRVLYPEKSHTYEVTVDNVAMDWQRYEADLTKEVALKVANKYNDPKEAAEYAVLVAKAVVEGLKNK